MEASSVRSGWQRVRASRIRVARVSAVRSRSLVLALAGSWAVVFAVVNYLDYRIFLTRRFDLGNMVQAVWSTAHGRPFDVTEAGGEQISRLGAHVDPILAVFAPLWLVWPSAVMLLCAQAVLVAAGALPVFWLGRKHLPTERASLCLVGAYLLYPALAWQAVNDFHPTTIAIPFVLFAIWFLDEDRLWAFAGTAVVLVLCQEQIGILVACLGLWYGLTRRRFFAGGLIASLALGWSVFAFSVVIPHFGSGPSPYHSRYTAVGGSPLEIVKTIVTDPVTILGEVGTGRDVFYLCTLLLPLAGLFLRSPGLLIAGAPQLGMTLLSSRPSDLGIGGPVTGMIVPFLIGATIFGVAKLKDPELGASVVLVASAIGAAIIGPLTFLVSPIAMLLLAVVVVSVVPLTSRVRMIGASILVLLTVLVFAQGLHYVTNAYLVTEQFRSKTASKAHAVSLIPPDTAVSATNKLGSHLSARRHVYSFPLTDRADWIAVDVEDSWMPWVAVRARSGPGLRVRAIEGFMRPRVMAARIAALRADPRWELVYEEDRVLVFRRVLPSAELARQASART
jgi:uncharacterized membrane protein